MTMNSWVPGADASGFSLANLPYGVALVGGEPRLCVAIGSYALDLAAVADEGQLDGLGISRDIWNGPTLNGFVALGAERHAATRARLQAFLGLDSPQRGAAERCLRERATLTLACPLAPGDFVDFFSSYHHAQKTLRIARPDGELHPNWHSLPVGYHSRTGTIVGPEAAVVRPWGQQQLAGGEVAFQPSQALDMELEIGFVISRASQQGYPVAGESFADYVFGLTLLNDWSARDLQRWESTPLGPFHAKSFATQVGPWVVPLAALDGHRHANPHGSGTFDYLRHGGRWSFDIALSVGVQSEAMREQGLPPEVISRVNFMEMYWDGAQQLAHLTANGASVRPGDLFGSGTVSGPAIDSSGCLLELTSAGRNKFELPDGSRRGYLADGDRVVLTGRCVSPGAPPIDFGELGGTVVPAIDLSRTGSGAPLRA